MSVTQAGNDETARSRGGRSAPRKAGRAGQSEIRAARVRRVDPKNRALWWTALLASLIPGLLLGLQTLGWFGGLGSNPVERLLHDSGQAAMIALLVALAVTPVRRLTGWTRVMKLRRMLGLVAFAYVTGHFLIWLGVDLYFDWLLVVEDLVERPYITVGFAAFVILALLAATSFDAALRRLGRRWVWLHRGVYGAAVLALLHFVWLTRADYREAWIYGGVLALLLLVRVFHWLRKVWQRRRPVLASGRA